jgi:hypothetical protein
MEVAVELFLLQHYFTQLLVGTGVNVGHDSLVLVRDDGDEQVHHQYHNEQGGNNEYNPFVASVTRRVGGSYHQVEHTLRGGH